MSTFLIQNFLVFFLESILSGFFFMMKGILEHVFLQIHVFDILKSHLILAAKMACDILLVQLIIVCSYAVPPMVTGNSNLVTW